MTKENPFTKRMKLNDSFIHGRKSEENLSKRLGMKQQPGSGNMEGAKGDLKGQKFLIEAKSTIHDSVSVELSWLAKINYEARDMAKNPALAVTFVTKDGKPRDYGRWVMIPETLFEELTDENS